MRVAVILSMLMLGACASPRGDGLGDVWKGVACVGAGGVLMRFALVWNWRQVLRYAWSIRLILLAGLLSGAEVALPLLAGVLPVPPGVFAFLSFLATAGAFVARLIAQETVSGGEARS